jgi:acyl-CoA synthetase (AMP-forming)/AMP-acid ligase II
VWEIVRARAEATPNAMCVIDGTGATRSFADLYLDVEAVAAGLARLGIGPGSVVSWQLPNTLDAVLITLALCRLDAVQNPIVPISRLAEVRFMTDQLRSELLVVPERWRGFDYSAMAETIATGQEHLRTLVASSFPRAPGSELDPWRAPSDDPARWVIYTSGTSSEPKGAAHTDRSIMASARNVARRMRMTPKDRNAIVFPFAHVGGIWFLVGGLMCGSASILVERFGPDTIDFLSANGVTLAGSGPPFHQAYLDHRALVGTSVLPDVRAFPGGGQARPPDMHAELVRVFGAGIISGYGSTETGVLAMADVFDADEVRATTEGRPFAEVELRIVDGTGKLVASGSEGEICARGPGVMRSYVNAALNGDALDADGYFHTGDLGYLDAGGNLVINGRLKDIIIRNGENISAEQVEGNLAEHPAIAEVAVIGMPDERTGERACAVIVPRDPGTSVTLDQLREFLLHRGVTVQKIPEQLEVLATLPRTSTGKLMKNQIRDTVTSRG